MATAVTRTVNATTERSATTWTALVHVLQAGQVNSAWIVVLKAHMATVATRLASVKTGEPVTISTVDASAHQDGREYSARNRVQLTAMGRAAMGRVTASMLNLVTDSLAPASVISATLAVTALKAAHIGLLEEIATTPVITV